VTVTVILRPLATTWAKPAQWVRYAPVAAILATQAAYSIRLIPLGIASPDESRYVYAGHQLISEFWQSGGSPYYETYFSGAPDVYSPLAAMADHLGGLPEVRLMSTVFMLAATSLLFLTARRLAGHLPAVLAAGLFAGLGTTQVVGRNAIYDALAFLLVAVATYCAVRARDDQPRWLIAVPPVLVAAFFAKYMTIVFDPVVAGIAGLGADGFRRAMSRTLAVGAATVTLLVFAVYLAGGAYFKGMLFTTFARKTGADVILNASPLSSSWIIHDCLAWIGVVLALGAAGTVLAVLIPSERNRAATMALCLVAGILVTAEALHLHSAESMRRHDDLCAWFAAIPSGYALALPVQRIPAQAWKAVLALAAFLAVALSWAHYGQLPNNFIGQPGYDSAYSITPRYGLLKPYLELKGYNFLLSGDDGLALLYNDHIGIPWYRVVDDSYIKYPIPGRGGDWRGEARGPDCFSVRPGCMYLEQAAGFRAAIRAHDFALISLTRGPGHHLSTDSVIAWTVAQTPGYVSVAHIGGGSTWIYAPDYRHRLAVRPTRADQHSRPGPSAMAILRGLAVTQEPAAIFMVAGLLLTGFAVWTRRRRASPSYAPLWAWGWFLLVMVTAVTLELAKVLARRLGLGHSGRHAPRGRPIWLVRMVDR